MYDLMCPETRVLHAPDSFFLGISQVRNHRVSAHTKVRRSPSANRAVRRQATFGRMPPHTSSRKSNTPTQYLDLRRLNSDFFFSRKTLRKFA